MSELIVAKARIERLKEVVLAMREWIDAVPSDTPLPTMPGFDRDWADEVLSEASGSSVLNGLSASDIVKALPKLNQCQDSSVAQLRGLLAVGVKLGLYDACDAVKHIIQK